MIGIISKITAKTSVIAGKIAAKASAKSPELLMAMGAVGIIGTGYACAKAGIKSKQIMENYKKDIEICDKIKKAADEKKILDDYSPDDYKTDISIAKMTRVKNLAITWAVPVIFGSLTFSCFLGSHNILKKRNLALLGAYITLNDGFKAYRKNVIEELDEEADIRFRDGIKLETVEITEVDENGKKKKKKSKVETVNGEPSGYTYIYDEDHCLAKLTDWSYARNTLTVAENSANEILKARGYIFLNEVLRSIGMSEVPEGQIVGWEMKGNGDGFVDFGVKAVYVKNKPTFILNFNVDGPIYNNISKYTRMWG